MLCGREYGKPMTQCCYRCLYVVCQRAFECAILHELCNTKCEVLCTKTAFNDICIPSWHINNDMISTYSIWFELSMQLSIDGKKSIVFSTDCLSVEWENMWAWWNSGYVTRLTTDPVRRWKSVSLWIKVSAKYQSLHFPLLQYHNH